MRDLMLPPKVLFSALPRVVSPRVNRQCAQVPQMMLSKPC
jgi:hypothetical protein